jgi:ribosome-binding factor A
MERHRRGAAHPYPRTARVNVLLREVLATEIERLADVDERLRMVTVTEVVCAPDLKNAVVYCASLPPEAAVGLDEKRRALQALIGREIRTKRTPLLSFSADPVIAEGERIEAALRRAAARDAAARPDDGDAER